jgi:hypothetical protein
MPSDNTTTENMRAMNRSLPISGGKTRHSVATSPDSNPFGIRDRPRSFGFEIIYHDDGTVLLNITRTHVNP